MVVMSPLEPNLKKPALICTVDNQEECIDNSSSDSTKTKTTNRKGLKLLFSDIMHSADNLPCRKLLLLY